MRWGFRWRPDRRSQGTKSLVWVTKLATVGAKFADLGAKVVVLGVKLAVRGVKSAVLGTKLVVLGAQRGHLGGQVGRLGRQARRLGCQVGDVGRQIGCLGCQDGRLGLARHAKTVSNTSRNDFLTLFAGSARAPMRVSYQFLQCFDDPACMSHHMHACSENT